jgi:hypothetical protein
MTRSTEGIWRRRRAQALVFGAVAAALLVGPLIQTRGFEPALVLLVVSVCALAYGTSALRPAARLGRRLGAKPLVSAVLIGALAAGLSVASALHRGLPVPQVSDEFSYLLAADTFAHGRLTNPTHPMWVHFEALQVLHQPTYMSKYPPAQGLALALGQVVFGHPIVGVWLSAGLACGALTWMLSGWMPGRWALAGGLLTTVHPLMISWSQTYWGGLVAALGGALVLGALGRIGRRPRARHSAVLGVGLGILANSRPYEGIVLAFPLLIALGIWILSRRGPPAAVAMTRIVVPLGSVLLLIGAGMLYYNYRGTGHPLTMPYVVYERTYDPMPLFLFARSSPPPVYRHERLRLFFVGQLPKPVVRTLGGLASTILVRADAYAQEYLGSVRVAAMALLLAPLERSGWMLLALLDLGFFTIGLGLQSWRQAHYAAPGAGLALLVTMRAIHRVAGWGPRRIRLGRALAQALWIVAMMTLTVGWWHSFTSKRPAGWQDERARIAARLGRAGDKHLVLVRYAAGHHARAQWVYNAADIDAAPVVWAHEMDAASNARLVEYFKDRRVWVVEPDVAEVRVVPYLVPASSKPSSP